jgi:hypothetical protein
MFVIGSLLIVIALGAGCSRAFPDQKQKFLHVEIHSQCACADKSLSFSFERPIDSLSVHSVHFLTTTPLIGSVITRRSSES